MVAVFDNCLIYSRTHTHTHTPTHAHTHTHIHTYIQKERDMTAMYRCHVFVAVFWLATHAADVVFELRTETM